MPLHFPNATDRPHLAALAAQLAANAATFTGRGWMLGTSGSLSARTSPPEAPLSLLITVSGKDKGMLEPEDLLLVEDDGEVFDTLGDPRASSEAFYAGQPRPSGEVLVHREVLERFRMERGARFAGAVCHTHSVACTLCTLLVQPGQTLALPPVEMLKGLGHWEESPLEIPVVANARDIPHLAALVGEAARPEVPGVLVAGHGIYAWGPDAMRARRNLETFEFLFDLILQARRLQIDL